MDQNEIATTYARVMQERYGAHHNGQPGDMHQDFAKAIIDKNAYGLKYLANGLNDAAKLAFTQVTGLPLPKNQGQTWKAIRDWASVSDQQDAVVDAVRKVAVEVRFVKDCTVGFDSVHKLIHERLDAGFTRLIHQGKRWLLCNADGDGIDLSQRGSRLHKLRPLIAAELALRDARSALAKADVQGAVCECAY